MGGGSRRLPNHLVCGARPNFMKVAPLDHALVAEPWATPVIVRTGQYYGANMSGAFFAEFRLLAPPVCQGVDSGGHSEQVARVMVAYERILQEQRPRSLAERSRRPARREGLVEWEGVER